MIIADLLQFVHMLHDYLTYYYINKYIVLTPFSTLTMCYILSFVPNSIVISLHNININQLHNLSSTFLLQFTSILHYLLVNLPFYQNFHECYLDNW
jgi:hypothetical protein